MVIELRGTSKGPEVWLLPGILCLLIGISFPTSKLYHQALALLLWVPGLVLLWTSRTEIRPMLHSILGVALLTFVLWSALSLLWSSDDDPLRQFKQVLYVVVTLWTMRLFGLSSAVSI